MITPAPRPLKFPHSPEISASRAAQILKCSLDTIYRLVESGNLAAYRLGERGWLRIYHDSVIGYRDECLRKAGLLDDG